MKVKFSSDNALKHHLKHNIDIKAYNRAWDYFINMPLDDYKSLAKKCVSLNVDNKHVRGFDFNGKRFIKVVDSKLIGSPLTLKNSPYVVVIYNEYTIISFYPAASVSSVVPKGFKGMPVGDDSNSLKIGEHFYVV